MPINKTHKDILIGLGLDPSKAKFALKEFQKDAKKGNKAAKSLKNSLRGIQHRLDSVVPSFKAMGLAITGVALALREMGERNKEIKKVHEFSKVSLSTIQELKYAAEKTGF